MPPMKLRFRHFYWISFVGHYHYSSRQKQSNLWSCCCLERISSLIQSFNLIMELWSILSIQMI